MSSVYHIVYIGEFISGSFVEAAAGRLVISSSELQSLLRSADLRYVHLNNTLVLQQELFYNYPFLLSACKWSFFSQS